MPKRYASLKLELIHPIQLVFDAGALPSNAVRQTEKHVLIQVELLRPVLSYAIMTCKSIMPAEVWHPSDMTNTALGNKALIDNACGLNTSGKKRVVD